MSMSNAGWPRVAVIGSGYWGQNLVRNFADLGSLAAIVDRNRALAQSLALEHGTVERELAAVLADERIEAVVVAAPAAQHHVLAFEAISAGKHVFCEKPLALRVADAIQVVDAAESGGCTLMVGHLLRYHPAFVRLQELVADGELGRVQYLYSNRLNLGRIRREEDILWSFAPHDISMILALVGSEPDSIRAVGAKYLHKSIADVTITHLGFPGGEQAHVFVSWLHPVKEQRLVVVGDRGMAVFDDSAPWESKLQLYRHRIDWHDGRPDAVRAASESVPIESGEPLRAECEHFLDCVAGGMRPLTDGAEGLRVLRVLEAAGESMAVESGPTVAAPTAPGLDKVSVHPSSYVEDDVLIGSGTKVWHFCHVLSGSRIGADCSLGQNVMVGPDVSMGDGCRIQNNVSLYSGVTLGNDVFCGPSAVFTNVSTPRAGVSRHDEFAPTMVEDGVTIGANATVVCGNRLGTYSFIAAGAVVTGDVKPHALVTGVPARQQGWVSHDGEVLGDDLTCPRSGRTYEVVDGELREQL